MELSKNTVIIDEKMQEEISEQMRSLTGQNGVASVAQGACLEFVSKITDACLFGYFESSEEALASFASLSVFGRILLNAYGISDDTIDSEIGKVWYHTKTSVEESLKKINEQNVESEEDEDESGTEESPESSEEDSVPSNEVESADESEETVS